MPLIKRTPPSPVKAYRPAAKSPGTPPPSSSRLSILRQVQRTPHGSARALQRAWRAKAARNELERRRKRAEIVQREESASTLQGALRGREDRRRLYRVQAVDPAAAVVHVLRRYAHRAHIQQALPELMQEIAWDMRNKGNVDRAAANLLRLKLSPSKKVEILDALPISCEDRARLAAAMPTSRYATTTENTEYTAKVMYSKTRVSICGCPLEV